MLKQLPSIIISLFAVITSFLAVLAPPFVDKLRDTVPELKRSVFPGKYKTIYKSRLNRDRVIVLDIANIEKVDRPTINPAQIKDQQKRITEAIQDSFVKRSILYINDQADCRIDSVYIDCFTRSTYDITVPPRGTLVLYCVQGCNTSFCSYEFLNFE